MSGAANLVLDMHLGDRIIGELSFDPATESFAVSYSQDWQQNGFPISPMIPLDGTGSSTQIAMFLGNLLPENRGLDYLIESLGVSRAIPLPLSEPLAWILPVPLPFLPRGLNCHRRHFEKSVMMKSFYAWKSLSSGQWRCGMASPGCR